MFLRNLPDPVVCPDHGLKLGPLGFELFLPFQLLPSVSSSNSGSMLGFFPFVEGKLGEPALVVDGDGCPVRFGPGDVIDADVVSEDGAGVGVVQFDEGPR